VSLHTISVPNRAAFSHTERLLEILGRGRNPDGGWGYYPGKYSRLEPTAWATLALHTTVLAQGTHAALGLWPTSPDGLLLERLGGTPNHAFHGLALLVMFACGIEHDRGNASLVAALERVRGIPVEPGINSRQDNSLRAWSWIADTFSWVEPTAWCLLATKKWLQRGTRVGSARLADAERLLINRCCVSGGWNYGNSDVLGKELRPYVPTTAVALLAMQDRRDHPVVRRSIDFLETHATTERSGTALGLAAVALHAHGRDDAGVGGALIDQLSTTIELRNHAGLAIAACALERDYAHAAFTL
jgi:hypothetical protein